MKLWNSVRRFFRRVRDLEVQIYAAYAAYFWVLAVFPGMMLLIAVLQYTPISPGDLRELLYRVVPASLHALTDYMIDELFLINSPAILSISAVTGLWIASKGVVSLHRGLNRVYAARETRNALAVRLRCVLFTLAGVLALVLILGVHLASRELIAALRAEGSSLGKLLERLFRLKYVVTVGVLTLFFTAMYTVFPNREVRVAASLPGAFVTAVLWVCFSQLFTLYVERFGNFSLYYGSLSVMALAMLWLYVCIFLFLCGGILNRELELARRHRRSKQDH